MAPFSTWCSSGSSSGARFSIVTSAPAAASPRSSRSTSHAPAVSSASMAARSMRTRRAGGSFNWPNLRSSDAAPAMHHSPPARSTSASPPPSDSIHPSAIAPFYREATGETLPHG